MGNWHILALIGHSEIEVVPGNPATLRYKFSCARMLVFTTIGVGAVSLIAHSPVAFLIGMLWLFGVNYLIEAVRLPGFVRKAAAPGRTGE